MNSAPRSFYLSLVAAVLLAASALALGTGFSEELYAPGKVIEKHGDAKCLDCHKPFRGAVAKGCLSGNCHTKAELEGKGEKKLKPAVVSLHTGQGWERCLDCHTEHRGQAGVITLAYHDDTGRQSCLRCHRGEGEDAHPKLTQKECSSCHSYRDWKDAVFTHEQVSAQPCAECHGAPEKDFHASLPKAAGTGDSDCGACHDTQKWKPATFDHTLILSGRGAQGNPQTMPACSECHGSEAITAHVEITFQGCQACHSSTEDWKRIKVDHDSVAGEACTACHATPKGELHASISNDCKACHNVKSWKPARFEHQLIKRGQEQGCARCHGNESLKAHPGIKSDACATCHKSTQDWRKVTFSHSAAGATACANCHRAPGGALHAGAKGASCATCHSTVAWRPSTFRHPRIPEFGEHMEHLACADCHPSSLSQAQPCSACHGGGGRGSRRREWDDD